MSDPVAIYSIQDALAWGEDWERRAGELERALDAALRELRIQRIFADQFADALERKWAEDKFKDL